MLYVPDANVAIKWFFNEEFSDKARLLMAHLIDGREQATAPDLLRLEFAHVLRKRVVQQGIPASSARDIRDDFNAVPILWRASQPLAGPALDRALSGMVSFYDSLYLEVARESGAVVVSADAGLVANGSQLGRTLHVREYGEARADQP